MWIFAWAIFRSFMVGLGVSLGTNSFWLGLAAFFFTLFPPKLT